MAFLNRRVVIFDNHVTLALKTLGIVILLFIGADFFDLIRGLILTGR